MWIFVSSFRENGRVCVYLKMEVLYFRPLHWSLYFGPGGLDGIARAFVKADDTEF